MYYVGAKEQLFTMLGTGLLGKTVLPVRQDCRGIQKEVLASANVVEEAECVTAIMNWLCPKLGSPFGGCPYSQSLTILGSISLQIMFGNSQLHWWIRRPKWAQGQNNRSLEAKSSKQVCH